MNKIWILRDVICYKSSFVGSKANSWGFVEYKQLKIVVEKIM